MFAIPIFLSLHGGFGTMETQKAAAMADADENGVRQRAGQQFVHREFESLVYGGTRFVEEDDTRTIEQSAANCYSLLFAER